MVKLFILLQSFLGNIFLDGNDTLKILFAGDIMQHKEQLASALKRGADPKLASSYNYDGYFDGMADLLTSCDINIANMETTFAESQFSGYPVFASPNSLLYHAFESGFNVFLTANNHICDKGKKGLEYTINSYSDKNIPFTGIARDSASCRTNNPLVLNVKGHKIALLNYTYGTNGIKVADPIIVKRLDSVAIKRDAEYLASLNCDIVFATVHWGNEYSLNKSASQEKWKRLFNRLGINYIIGSHPHVTQEMVIEKDADSTILSLTHYSLGNLISNMTAPYTRMGLALILTFVKDRGKSRLISAREEYLWTARPGEFNGNYAVVQVSAYSQKPELFKKRESYKQMMDYYNKLITYRSKKNDR